MTVYHTNKALAFMVVCMCECCSKTYAGCAHIFANTDLGSLLALFLLMLTLLSLLLLLLLLLFMLQNSGRECVCVCESAKLQVVQTLGFDAPIKQLYVFVVVVLVAAEWVHFVYVYICV